MWSRAIQAWHAGHCRHDALHLVLLTQSNMYATLHLALDMALSLIRATANAG